MDVAIAIENSRTTTSSTFNDVKTFLKRLIRSISSSENNIHFSLLEYGNNATVLTDFRKYRDESYLEKIIDDIPKRNDSQRRVDIALNTTKEKIFSLEGGMRQGYPRFLIFIASNDSTSTFSLHEGAAKQLRDLGVTIVAIGTNRNIPRSFLEKLAGNGSFVYKANEANEMSEVLSDLTNKMSAGKRLFYLQFKDKYIVNL